MTPIAPKSVVRIAENLEMGLNALRHYVLEQEKAYEMIPDKPCDYHDFLRFKLECTRPEAKTVNKWVRTFRKKRKGSGGSGA
jgi:hypothetical protein